MLEIKKDMWELARSFMMAGEPAPAIFITTNGFVKTSGEAVMGRGCAYEAREMFPGIALTLGKSLASKGNSVAYLGTWTLYKFDYRIFSFPVKHNWWEPASLDLIEDSCNRVAKLRDKLCNLKIIIPRPGCGNGKLDWDNEVKPLILSYLDFDNVYITYK